MIFDLIKKYYEKRDNSHGIEHIKEVVKWTSHLVKKEDSLSNKDKIYIETSAYLHDAYDHKYSSKENVLKIKEQIREELINNNYQNKDIDNIFIIIDNISFSKEFKARSEGRQMDLGELQKVRDIVSDADKIEAVGIPGITRMIQFEQTLIEKEAISTNVDKIIQRHIDHIRTHYNEKLYLLITNNYIKTDIAKYIVSNRIEEMKIIIDDEDKLISFIKKELNIP